MRILMLGGTRFIGRRIVERLHDRGDEVLVVSRGTSTPEPWIPVSHLQADRRRLAEHAPAIRRFDPEAVVDTFALTAADVDAVLPVLPQVPAVVLSSQDVYEAFTGLHAGRCVAAVPLTEDSALRTTRYPYRDDESAGALRDYDKLDVEDRWLPRGAVALRLPMVYGPHDGQRREEPVLRRVRAGRSRIPIGTGNLLWTKAHVDDVATGVLAALDTRAADGLAVNLGELQSVPLGAWYDQILSAAGSDSELVRVADDALPPDLELTGSFAQPLLVSSARAQELLGWAPRPPEDRVADSVRWHLEHPPETAWTAQDDHRDDQALDARSA